MKKIYSIFTLLLGIFALSSCVTEVDDVFDKSASERAQEAINETKTILESPANGWRMEYYGSTTYGGYNVLLKFDGDSVIIGSEAVGDNHKAGVVDGKAVTCKSHYKIEQSMGVTISMDEYNSVFHYFSDPYNADYGVDGEGMAGDLEFRVVSCTKDKIELKGKKHDTKILMYPMDENTSWESYIESVKATENFMKSRSYTLSFGEDKTVPCQSNYRRLQFLVTDEEGNLSYTYAPFVVTPAGYVFYNPVTINGVELTGFDKADTEEFFYATGNNSVKLITEVPPLYKTFASGLWYLKYDDMGEYGKSQWDVLLKKLEKAENNSRARLAYACVGTITSKYSGFMMMAGSTEHIGGMIFSPVKDEAGNVIDNQIKITWNSAKDGSNNMGYKYYQNNKYGIKSAMDPFCGGAGHTFELSTDNARHPKYIILTDVKVPNNVIKVSAESISYPFGDLDNDKKD